MKLVKIFTISIMAFAVLCCNDDDTGDPDQIHQVNCAEFGSDAEVQAAVDAFVDAANVYYQDPTEEHCNAYLDALDNYFTEIEIYLDDCYHEESFDEFRDAVDEWRAERDQLDCGA